MSDFSTDDIDSIASYFGRTPAVTPAAVKLKDKFTIWFKDLGWYDRNMDTDNTFNEARNRRNEFNEKNAVTAKERENVKRVIHTGFTAEEAQGRPKAMLSTGRYVTDLVPTKWLVGAGIVAVAGVAGFVAKKVYYDPEAALVKRLAR